MAKTTVMVLGVVFVLLGVLGFFSDPILGMFETDTTHNWVHLLSGVVALVMSMQGESMAKLYGKIFGVIYALVTVLGFMGSDVLGLITVNGADNVLHLVLAVLLLWVGFAPSRSSSPMMPPSM